MSPEAAPPADDVDRPAARSATAGPAHRAGARGRRGRHGRGREPLPWWVEFPLLVAIALVLALLIKTFLVQAFFIPSGSMEQTLRVGDRVLVEKLSYRFGSIQRGDIVVFDGIDSFDVVPVQPPSNPVLRTLHNAATYLGLASSGHDYIKRVIGLPGDVVACCDARGRVTVNGVALDEPYVYDAGPVAMRAFGPVKVPAGRLWVMGDHRGNSRDSRFVGAVPADKVVGRSALVIWPPSHWGTLGRPATFANPALARATPPPFTPTVAPTDGGDVGGDVGGPGVATDPGTDAQTQVVAALPVLLLGRAGRGRRRGRAVTGRAVTGRAGMSGRRVDRRSAISTRAG